MSWRRRFTNSISPLVPAKKNRTKNRVLLHLEELETRALLSVSGVTAQPDITVLPSSTTTFSGYTPQQLQTAYGIPGQVNGQLAGTGETIAIVDAYNDPNLANDLATFDAKYGLAAPPSFKVVNQSGGTTLPTNNSSWAVEESLDVEWAHAVAPGAKIVLVEANSSSLNDLLSAVGTASSMANVVSMSWGAGEFNGETSYDKYFTTPGVTYVASAGDSSAYVGPEWPASSPNVLAVGGTTLNLTSSNTISSETAWSATYSRRTGYQGGGAGISSYETAPSFQSGIPVAQNYDARTTPDVAWDANPSTGVTVYDSYLEPGWGYVGGTSVGAPSWSGVAAIADQQSVANGHGNLSTSQVENSLYGVYTNSGGANYKSGASYTSDFNDITSGSNGYQAVKGYDLATGLGSPNVGNIAALLGGPSSGSTTTVSGGTTASSSSGSSQGSSGSSSPSSPQQVWSQSFVVLELNDIASSGGVTIESAFIVSVSSAPVSMPSTGSSSLVNSVFPFGLTAVAPSTSLEAQAPVFAGSLNSPAPQDSLVFGASGWNGSAFSWRLSSLGMLPSPQTGPVADDMSEDLEDVDATSTGDVIDRDSDAVGEDWSILDIVAPPLLDGPAGEGGDSAGGGEGGGGGE